MFIVKIAKVIHPPFGHHGFDVIHVSHGEAEEQQLHHKGSPGHIHVFQSVCGSQDGLH